MKQFFIFLFFIMALLISFSLVSAALSLSQSKLYFNINPQQENCQKITVSSQDYFGNISIRDVWSEDFNQDANINKYTANPKDL